MRIPTLFAFASLALAACGDGTGPGSLDRGEFQGDIKGEYRASLSGEAESGNTVGFDQDQLLLVDESEDVVVFAFHQDEVFTEGVEQLADVDENFGIWAGVLVDGREFWAEGGTMDIDDISENGIRGSMRFTAVEIDRDAAQILTDEVTVDVDFNARYDNSCCGFNLIPTSTRVRVTKTPR
jgi:hypothetical protein